MKESPLTKNGVMLLYDSSTNCSIKVQVVFSMLYHNHYYARLSDGKQLSPIVRFPKHSSQDPPIYVGHVLDVNQTKLVESDPALGFFMDDTLPYLFILAFSVVEQTDSLYGEGAVSECTAYYASIKRISPYLVKFDHSLRTSLERGETRQAELSGMGDQMRERGNALFKKGLYKQAAACYESASRLKLYDDRIFSNHSLVSFHLEEFSKALMLAMYAIKLNPFNIKAYYRACQCLEETKEHFQLFIQKRACRVVCGPCSDMDKFPDRDFSTFIPPEQTFCRGSGGGGRGRARSQSAVKAPPSVGDAADKKSTQANDKKSKPSEDKKKKKADHAREASKASERSSTSSKDTTVNEKKQDSQAAEKKKSEQEPVLAPGYSNSGKDLACVSVLKEGRRLYREAKYDKALDLYRTAVDSGLASHRPKNEQKRLSLMVCLCLVETGGVQNCIAALAALKTLLPTSPAAAAAAAAADDDSDIPRSPVYYLLTMAYHRTWQYAKVTSFAALFNRWFPKDKHKLPINLPAFMEPIAQTEVKFLEKWYSEKPWLKTEELLVVDTCRYSECELLAGTGHHKHIVHSADLYTGHVELTCEESCHIFYHPTCWRIIKDQKAAADEFSLNKNKLSDKDFLSSPCLTPDCTGSIESLRIFDETKSVIQDFIKERAPSDAKPKKKKNRKKNQQNNQFNKNKNESAAKDKDKDKDNSKADTSNSENTSKDEQEAPEAIIKKSKGLSKPGSTLPLHELDFQNCNIKVIKREPLDPDDTTKKTKKEKKNKKQRALDVERLVPDITDSSLIEQNEYLAKIRRLNAQKEALERSAECTNDQDEEEEQEEDDDEKRGLDPSFYSPSVLQTDPVAVTELFADKLNISSKYSYTRSSNIPNQAKVEALLSFLEDFVVHEGPLKFNDREFHSYIKENLPPESLECINVFGGIKEFLNCSPNFVILDDYVCSYEHVGYVQELLFADIVRDFPDFSISDEYQAKSYLEPSRLFQSSSENSLASENCSSPTSLEPAAEASSEKFIEASNSSAIVQSTSMDDVQSTSMVDVQSTSADVQPKSSNDTQSKSSEDAQSTLSNDIQSQSPEDVQSTGSNDIQSKSAEDFQSSGSNDIQSKSSDDIQYKASKPKKEDAKKSSESDCVSDDTSAKVKKYSASNGDEPPRDPASSGELSAPSMKDSSTETESSSLDGGFQTLFNDDAHNRKELQLEKQVVKLQRKLEEVRKEKKSLENELSQMQQKFSDLSHKRGAEVSTLKKQLADAEENFQSRYKLVDQMKAELSTEQRRYNAEKKKLAEENKNLQTKVNALEVREDCLKDEKRKLEQEVQQINVSAARQAEQLSIVEASLTSASSRSKTAELGYIDLRSSMIKDIIGRTLNFYQTALARFQELHCRASVMSVPSSTHLQQQIERLKQHCDHLLAQQSKLISQSDRLRVLINNGRPLNDTMRNSLGSLPDDMFSVSLTDLMALTQNGTLLVSPRGTPGAAPVAAPENKIGAAVATNAPDLPPAGQVTPTSERQISVGNLPSNISEHKLKALFSRFGEVEAAEVLPGLHVAFITFGHKKDYLSVLSEVATAPMMYDSVILDVRPVTPSVHDQTSPLQDHSAQEDRIAAAPATKAAPTLEFGYLYPGNMSIPQLVPWSRGVTSPYFRPALTIPTVPTPPGASAPISPGQSASFSPGASVQVLLGKNVPVSVPTGTSVPTIPGTSVPVSPGASIPVVTGSSAPNVNVPSARKLSAPVVSNAAVSIFSGPAKSTNAQAKPAASTKSPSHTVSSPKQAITSAGSLTTASKPSVTPSVVTKANDSSTPTTSSSSNAARNSPRVTAIKSRTSSPASSLSSPSHDHSQLSHFGVKPKVLVGAGANVSVSTPRTAARPAAKASDVSGKKSHERLADVCQLKFAKLGLHSSRDSILEAIAEVRRSNNNRLSGLAEDVIIQRVRQLVRPKPTKNNGLTPIAPWANAATPAKPVVSVTKTVEDIENKDCIICFNEITGWSNTKILDCGHFFHKECINDWFAEKRECPLCRRLDVDKEEYPPLSLKH